VVILEIPYGGGGSGGLAVGSGTGNGGGGSQGLIVITYVCPTITVSDPGDVTIPVCNDQAYVDGLFDTWINTFDVTGGAGLVSSTTTTSLTAPDRCGGTVTFVLSYTSECGNATITRTFTVTEDAPLTWVQAPPDDFVLNAPSDDCELQVTWPTVSVTDDCPSTVTRVLTSSVALTENVPNTHGDFPVGVSSVNYTYTDGCAHVISKTFTVTIIDVTAPTLTGCPSPITVNTDPGLCTAVVTWTPPTASDNCLGYTMVSSHNSGQAFPVGVSTVTYVATDASGNSNTCTFTVTVNDNQVPLITCPTSPQTANNDPGQCYASLTFAATVSDNCAIATTTYSIGATPITFPYNFPVGTSTVTVYVEDVNGLSNTCDFYVVVTDNELPVVNTQNIASLELSASGMAYITPAQINNVSTDNCGIASYTLDVSSFDCDDLGLNTVTLTVTDIHGNSNTGTATVFVVDLIDPVIACIGAQSFDAPTGTCSYTFTGADHWGIDTESDNCSITTYTYTLAGATTGSGSSINGQVFNVGVTTVTWTVYDQSGNDATCSFAVTVNDIDDPVLSMPTVAASYNADATFCYASLDLPATASDNCGIDHIKYYIAGPTEITLPYNFPVGSTVVTVIATDVNGLTDTDTYTVVVVDNQDPVISCAALSPTIVTANPGDCSKEVVLTLPVATDNCGINTYTLTADASPAIDFVVFADPLDGFKIKAEADYPVGTTNVTLTVSDVNGRTSSCTFSVTVHHFTLPNAVATATTLQLDATGNVTLNSATFSAGSTPASGHCAFGSIVVSPTAFTCANVGANVVTVTVTDKTGRVSTATATVTVEDNVFPVVTPQNATVYLDASGNGSIVYGDVIASYTDACGTLTPTISPSTFTCSDVALSPVTINISVSDVNGNVTTSTAQVTVLDEVDPTALAQNITVQLDGTGNVTITAAQIDNGSSDACGIVTATMTVSPSAFTCDDLGPNEVTLTVYDVNGNSSTATATVTVEDDEDPVITCNGTTQTVSTNTACTYVHSGTGWDATATDNCDVTVAYALTGATTGTGTSLAGVAFNVGVTTVTWTATDEDGNTDVCSFTITVEDNESPVFTVCPTNQSILTEGPEYDRL
jgi:large repetitive protein